MAQQRQEVSWTVDKDEDELNECAELIYVVKLIGPLC